MTEPIKVDGSTSDGYHTFDELYRVRMLLNAALFNEWYDHDLYKVHKSKRHHDGEMCFGGGWFVVMAEIPEYRNDLIVAFRQISFHYEEKYWDLFKVWPRQRANEWDGHTAEESYQRLENFLRRGSNG